MKKTVLFICGGRSDEHEISLISAKCILEALDRERYEPLLVGVRRDGTWTLQDPADFYSGPCRADQIKLKDGQGDVTLATKPGRGQLHCGDRVHGFDVVFPIIHGPFGEDGRLQGLLDMLDLPYVGSGCAASAVCMDKILTKVVCEAHGIRTAPYAAVLSPQDVEAAVEKASSWAPPYFVKPARLGSSVGVERVTDIEKLAEAIRRAFQHDTKVLVERGIKGREVECAVLGNHRTGAEVAVPGEIIPASELGWYSYEAKYLDGGAKVEVPAKLDEDTQIRLQAFARRVFEVLECDGLARVDCFLEEETEEPYLNEPNTLPGFTPISMYPKMWDASGLAYSDLITRLIELGEARHNA